MTKILRVEPDPIDGLRIKAQLGCGHDQWMVFPYASRRTPKSELVEWCGNRCSACEREQAA